MVRKILQVGKGESGWWYALACGHTVPATDYKGHGPFKQVQWCPACWEVERGRPT